MAMSFRSLTGLAALLAAAVPLLASADARAADSKAQCIAAYEQGQKLKQEAKFSEARKQLLMCARDVCPDMLRSDCEQWLKEVDQAIPSVVIAAKDAKGADITDVRVTIDGKLVTERLDGKQIPLDPGDHTMKFEHADAGTVEQKILIREGEKHRVINVSFGGGGVEPAGPKDTKTPGEVERPIPALTWVFGGLGLVGLGSFAYFGLTGKSEAADYESCKPACNKSDVDATRTKLIVADVSLGVGVASLALATYLFVTRSEEKPAPSTGLRLNINPTVGGAFAGVSTTF